MTNGYPPTVAEIMVGLSVTSSNGVRTHLQRLQEHGLLNRAVERIARGIRITEAGHEFLKKKDELKTRSSNL